MNPRLAEWAFSIGVMLLGVGSVSGQHYPDKTIRILTTVPGSTSDIASRMIAQGISPNMGQSIVVENRPGIIAVDTVAKSVPDGYTLLHFGSTVWLLPYMRDNVPWNGIKDFEPISLTLSSVNLLVVHPALPVNSVTNLIALIKTKPGQFNHGISSSGTAPYFAVELLKALTGINIVAIPFKSNTQGLNAVVAGDVLFVLSTAATGGPFVKSGRLRALAVTSAEPSALFPGVPTVAASGVPGYESVGMTGLFVSAKTPASRIKRLNDEVVQFLSQPDVKSKFLSAGAEVVASSPAEFSVRIKSDLIRTVKLIKDANIRAD